MATTHHLSPEDLVAHEDGYAAGTRASRIETHLAGCPACRQRLREFADVGRLLRERFPVADDPAARARLMDKIDAAAERRKG